MKSELWIGIIVLGILSAGCLNSLEKMNPITTPGYHPLEYETEITMMVKMNYLLYLPADYENSQKSWPLIMFLHGMGERGDDVALVKKEGLPRILKDKDDFPFIVVSPQCPGDSWWPRETEVLEDLLKYIITEYDVDTERIYLTGLSMGGFGTWQMASEYPELFAAIAPICGGGEVAQARLGRLNKVPIWAFHGADDNVVPVLRSQEMVDAVNKAGGNAKLTVYPDTGHDSWTVTYDNPQLYEWFLQHRKNEEKE
ncbi:MAG: prolyl oligopeptidase family serine peptidase [Sedimentisphaerales bacterium]|nr:prolyl oligopeptidase family serine peptidase [Sedimentisphaerales bacterium]